MPRRPPFDMMRAAFLLLAAVLLLEVVAAILGGLICAYTNLTSTTPTVGACIPAGQQIHEVFSEVLTAVLALLLAARSDPPPPSE